MNTTPNQIKRYESAAKELAKPFLPEELEFRAQGERIFTYVNARAIRSRLNQVCGSNWSSNLIPVGEHSLICELTVFGVKRADAAGEQGWDAKDKIKGAASGALKRAAANHSIGEYLYDLPQWQTWQFNSGQGINRKALIQAYIVWLQTEGIRKFGLPYGMNSGDIELEDAKTDGPTYLQLHDLIAKVIREDILTIKDVQTMLDKIGLTCELRYANQASRDKVQKALTALIYENVEPETVVETGGGSLSVPQPVKTIRGKAMYKSKELKDFFDRLYPEEQKTATHEDDVVIIADDDYMESTKFSDNG